MIQKEKADFMRIEVTQEFEGFLNDEFDNQDGFMICSDMQRIQQVLLNLQSNALKFTPKGGRVEIKCKYLKDKNDSQ